MQPYPSLEWCRPEQDWQDWMLLGWWASPILPTASIAFCYWEQMEIINAKLPILWFRFPPPQLKSTHMFLVLKQWNSVFAVNPPKKRGVCVCLNSCAFLRSGVSCSCRSLYSMTLKTYTTSKVYHVTRLCCPVKSLSGCNKAFSGTLGSIFALW